MMTEKMMLTCGTEEDFSGAALAKACVTINGVNEDAIECRAKTLQEAVQLRDAVMLGMIRSSRLPPEQLLEIAESCQASTALVHNLLEFDLDRARDAIMAARAREKLRRSSADTVEQLEAVGWLLDELPALLRAYQALIKGLVQQETDLNAAPQTEESQ